ncbi:MAG: polysaccharide pyruvyl transferase [Novosphingobium sp.]|nr:polysaccharide pyruvyl transferase [Novosphingobium sp.]
MIAGDLHNLGDLALLLTNLDHARRAGRSALVRRWGPIPPQIVRQVEAEGGQIVDGRNLAAMLRLGAHCDLIIGGGQLVRQNTSLRALIYLVLLGIAVRRGGGRSETRGLGVSATHGLHRRLWRLVLGGCETLNLRDQTSLARARSLLPHRPARLTADMVLTGDLAARASPRGGAGPCIVVALCEDASESRAVSEAALQGLLDAARGRWPEAPVRAMVHDLRQGADREFMARVLHGRAGVSFDNARGNLGDFLAVYRDARMVITNRLHAGLFGTVFGRPVVVLDDGNDKLRVLHQQLGAARIDAHGDPAGDMTAVLDNAVTGAERRAAGLATLRTSARGNLPGGCECAIFNVKFSPNLGDGLIAECLETALRAARDGLYPRSIDLAGRTAYDPATGHNRRHLLGALNRLPDGVRSMVMPLLLTVYVRLHLRPKWRRQFAGCDVAVIGGGALLADADQNFPIKLSNVLQLCAERNCPVAIAHVGVTPGWSAQGRRRFGDALRRVRLLKVTVRDKESTGHFRAEFGEIGPAPVLAFDPGLLCCETYPAAARAAEEGHQRIGLCLTDPLILQLHGEGPVDTVQYRRWLRAVIERLAERPGELLLFTNGSPEDEQFATELFEKVGAISAVRLIPRHTHPGDLARFIASLDCVVAHRLHACIAAYSYTVPAVGLTWDKKLDRFFDVVGRGDFIANWREMSPGSCAALIERALGEAQDPAAHARILTQCRAGIAALADCLVEAKIPAPTQAGQAA